ncbi:MAG: serine/threonine-protein kinase [Planctomycetes bacterium]|nr:serine/threonine-protein kinase [Planctomycetota bacterium]
MGSGAADDNDAKTIFGKAQEFAAPAERAAYLAEACGGDAGLRGEVERLLAAAGEAGSFMAGPAVATLHTAAFQRVSEGPGTVIGPYKLMEQIGEGGFGLVFVAEQHRPVRRKVALKIIKPGMDTRDVIARFEAERQALALMDHPNIAKVFDAGATDTGRPYFVMELVRGIPITEYCDQEHLTPRERLELFVSLCHAIQHAHQKGIIHRDVKPTNVLVTLHDGRPVVKVIDFGVAKALSQQLTERTIYTQFAQMLGTPLYMSPEQAAMSGLDIDTRSDIYSLGVLLYELLTGTTPFDRERLKQAAVDEIRRIIREEEPPKPSTRLSQSGERLPSIAAQRNTEPAKLSKLVRGELDWIVMKCLEKDRNRRYETANGLARDVDRFLKDEPVQACPPSVSYTFRKFARRNKAALATVAIVAMSLVLGTAVSIWQATVARRAEALADARLEAETQARRQAATEAAKATTISDLLQQMLGSANPDEVKGANYTVRQLLDDFSAKLADQFKDQPEAEATVRATIGKAYWRLGMADQAEPHLKAALELRRATLGLDHESVAESLVDYAWNLAEATNYDRALECVEEALSIHRHKGSSREAVLRAMWAKQRFLISQGKYAEADATADAALTLAGDLTSVDIPVVANILHGLGDSLFSQGRYAEAENAARKAVALHRRLHGPDHPETAWGLFVLGRTLTKQEKFQEAESASRESAEIFRRQYDDEHKSTKYALESLNQVLVAKRARAGLETLDRQRQDEAARKSNPIAASEWIVRAQFHTDLGEWKQAVDAGEKVISLLEKSPSGAFYIERRKLANSYNSWAWIIATSPNSATSRSAACRRAGHTHRETGPQQRPQLERVGRSPVSRGQHGEGCRDSAQIDGTPQWRQ